MSAVSLSPEAIVALNALFAAPASTQPAQPAPAAPTQGMPTQLAGFWASDYKGKGVPTRQLANGRWVDVKGVFCKAPSTIKAPAQPEAAKPQAEPKLPPATMTIAEFAAKHPEVMADLKAAVLGTVFTTGGSWGEFRKGVVGR